MDTGSAKRSATVAGIKFEGARDGHIMDILWQINMVILSLIVVYYEYIMTYIAILWLYDGNNIHILQRLC